MSPTLSLFCFFFFVPLAARRVLESLCQSFVSRARLLGGCAFSRLGSSNQRLSPVSRALLLISASSPGQTPIL